METVAALYRLEDRRRRREGVDPVFLTLVLALLALGLTALGSGLYRLRDRSLTRQEREALILGDGRKEV